MSSTKTAPKPITLDVIEDYRFVGTEIVRIGDDYYEATLYRVPSRSNPAVPNEPLWVRDEARCTCNAYIYRGHCRHCDELPIARAFRWWLRVLDGSDAATLRDTFKDKGGLIRCDYDAADSRGCQLAAEKLLREMGAWEEEAA